MLPSRAANPGKKREELKMESKYVIGDIDLLDEEIRNHLIERAKSNETFKDFQIDIGWESWMDDFTDAEDGEPASESESDVIDNILRQAWEETHDNA